MNPNSGMARGKATIIAGRPTPTTQRRFQVGASRDDAWKGGGFGIPQRSVRCVSNTMCKRVLPRYNSAWLLIPSHRDRPSTESPVHQLLWRRVKLAPAFPTDLVGATYRLSPVQQCRPPIRSRLNETRHDHTESLCPPSYDRWRGQETHLPPWSSICSRGSRVSVPSGRSYLEVPLPPPVPPPPCSHMGLPPA